MRRAGDKGLVVGVADAAVGKASDKQLITYALGSCVGLTAYDPVARVGGLLHYMLPEPIDGPASDEPNVCVYASTGIPRLVEMLLARGAVKERLLLTASGGAQTLATSGANAIGERNLAMMRQMLAAMELDLLAEDTSGSVARTLSLDLVTGDVGVCVRNQPKVIWSRELQDAAVTL